MTISPVVKERARELFEQEGLGWQDIAAKLDLRPHTVRNWIIRLGWQKRQETVRENMEKAVKSTALELGAQYARESAAWVKRVTEDCKSLRDKIMGLLATTESAQNVKHLTGSYQDVDEMARRAFGLDVQQPQTLVNISMTGKIDGPLGRVKEQEPLDV